MARLIVRIKGERFDSVAAKLKGLAGGFEEPIRDSMTELQAATDERFEGQGFPPRKWAKHAPSTKKRRPGGLILRDKGSLMASVTTEGAEDGIFEVGGSFGQFGSRLVYAAVHQFGSLKKNADGDPVIPARSYLVVTDDDRDDIAEIFRGFVEEKIKEG